MNDEKLFESWRKFYQQEPMDEGISDTIGSVWDYIKDKERDVKGKIGFDSLKKTADDEEEKKPPTTALAVTKKEPPKPEERPSTALSPVSSKKDKTSTEIVLNAKSAIEKKEKGTDLTKSELDSINKTENRMVSSMLMGDNASVSKMFDIIGFGRPEKVVNLMFPLLGANQMNRLLKMDPGFLREQEEYSMDFYKSMSTRLKIMFKLVKTEIRKLILADIIRKYWEIVNGEMNPYNLKTEEERRRSAEIEDFQLAWINNNIKDESKK